MWGCISVDNAYIPNFSVGYTSMKSDVIVHLAQWQYWWWFWFSFLWGFYYLTANRVIRHRFLKFRPKIYTSFRSHGKWGDFLACVIPTIWCLNILTNSSFILRLMEWQNESSLFTIRVRARQWYWIYKFELRNVVDVITVPRNVGTNRWVVTFGGAQEQSNNYFHALKLRSQNSFFKQYWSDQLKDIINTVNSFDYNLDCENYSLTLLNVAKSLKPIIPNPNSPKKTDSKTLFSKNKLARITNVSDNEFVNHENATKKFVASKFFKFFSKLSSNINSSMVNNNLDLLANNNFFDFISFAKNDKFESTRMTKKIVSEIQPILVTKALPNKKDFFLLNTAFNAERTIKKRLYNNQLFLTIKQKRYKFKKFIPLRIKYLKNQVENEKPKIQFADRPFLSKNSFITNLEFEPTKLYQMLKKNKTRSEAFSVQLSRRLLRTRKTLVLPAHVNITLITNSYDVVHSWFLPGLGVKLDCVPGRSTHHTFYVDNVGFFYGQCAEICGRYHHHMPIRVCMLPYEHFFVWWQHFGLPKLLNTFTKIKNESDASFKKFIW